MRHPNRIARSVRALLAGLALAVMLSAGCDRSPSAPLLPPTGERITPAIGVISGRVQVAGLAGRSIRVYALREVDTTCVTTFNEIQVLGNYTDPEFSIDNTPAMERLLGCVWVDSVYLDPPNFARTPGRLQWKFVTNRAFDNPPDYGAPGADINGLEGAVSAGAPGDDGNLLADVSAAGPYFVTLDEERLRYSFLPYDDAPIATANRTTGEFAVDKLRDGTYLLLIRGEGIVTRRIPGVVLAGGAGEDLGTINLSVAETAIRGRVDFQGNPSPAPTATVTLLAGATTEVIDQVMTDGDFAFSGLANGAYRLRFEADGFRDSTQAVTYAGSLVDVGTVTLRAGCSSAYDRIQLAGNLNVPLYGNFDLALAPDMTEVEGCVWEATITVSPAGDHFFKFVTNNNFDNPPDYGGNEVCTTELSGAVTPVMGQGTALCITFPTEGDYAFRLDEEALTYTITPKGSTGGGTGRLKGRLAYSDKPSEPAEARVGIYRPGAANPIDFLDAVQAFSFAGVPSDTYVVRVNAPGYRESAVGVRIRTGQTTDVGTITLEPGCESDFARIQVAGNLNTDLYGNFDLTRSPEMTNGGDCVWTATVNNVQAGNRLFKFVTGGSFGADDYGSDEICRTDLFGPVQFVDGPGTAICVTFAEAGNYRFTLDEKTASFAIEKVVVNQPATIRGTVTFGGQPGNGRMAFVQLASVGGPQPVVIDSDSTGGAFEFTGFTGGAYELRVSAEGYLNTTRAATVASGQTLDVGAIDLTAGFSSRFNSIALIGNFPGINWEPANQRAMTQGPNGIWKVTLTGLSGGSYYFKFRTNDNWEQPDPDYGSNNDETCRPVLTGNVVLISSGGPNALCVTFPAGTADYEFTLDEIQRTYTIVRQGDVGTGRLTGGVSFSDITGAPIPVARIRLQAQGGSTDLGQALTDGVTGAWTLDQLDAGTYRIIAEAGCYQTVTVENLVVGTQTTVVPPITFAVGTSGFTRMQLLGSFNGFDLGSTPDMSKLSPCVWVDTLDITEVGTPIEFKFVTNGDFDSSPDYGTPGDQVDPASGPCVLGAGGSSGNIKVQLAEPGRYFFEIDERFPRYIVSRMGPIPAAARVVGSR